MLDPCFFIRPWLQREDGQALTEYAMLITFVVLALITSVALLGGAVSDYYSTIASAIDALF